MATTFREAHRPGAQSRRHLLALATLAIVGLTLLNASAWLLPLVSEYSLTGDYISELALGRLGIIQTAALLLVGLGTVGLAIAIRVLTRGNTGSLTGSMLLAIYGASAILAAIFPTDRVDPASEVWAQSGSGTIHLVATLAGFLCGVAGLSVLTHWTFRRAARWRSLSRWLVPFPSVALALLVVQSEGPLAGLLQRTLIGVISIWLIAVALKVRSIATSAKRTTLAH